jgi:hypothetical protein
MRSPFLPVAVTALMALTACHDSAPLAPTRIGDSDRNPDIPPELFANYTKVDLTGTGIVGDINDAGDAVGISPDGSGFLWSGAAHTRSAIPLFPGAIANDGTIAGDFDGHAVSLKQGSVVVLYTAASAVGAICRCASSTVVGYVEVNGQRHGAIWAGGVRIDAGVPPGGSAAVFLGIANGFVVGAAEVPTVNPVSGITESSTQAFTWSHAAGWRQLSGGGVLSSAVDGVNVHGTSVGVEDDALSPDLLGVMYDSAGNRTPLFGDPSFLRETIPVAINESGTMAGYFPDYVSGSLALVISQGSARVLPPGNGGDFASSINASGVIGGSSGGRPVLWIPNP